ncbi:hypothetical protein D3C81_1415090 [compost metagenome]
MASNAEVSPTGGSGCLARASKALSAASASPSRPFSASQRGDSGISLRSTKNSTIGTPPRKYITSQP